MKKLKSLVRKLLPDSLKRIVEQSYRIARALIAQLVYGWPTRGMEFIMITGTNGKTTTAHYLFEMLRAAGYHVGMSTTTSFQIDGDRQVNDTNMTVVDAFKLRRQLKEMRVRGVQYVILEATSQALDQNRLWGIPCSVAIMTNLTQDHLDYHGTMDNYAAAKARLFRKNIRVAILNADDAWFYYFQKACQGKRVVSYGQTGSVRLVDYKSNGNDSMFKFGYKGHEFSGVNRLTGQYNTYNALAAFAAAMALDVKPEVALDGIANTMAIAGRLELVLGPQKFKVVVDYAHTPDGLEKVLTAAKGMTKGDVWLVFGSCGDRDRVKRPIMGKIAMKLADKIVVTDEEPYNEEPSQIRREVLDGITDRSNVVEIADRREAMKHAFDHANDSDLVLITGLGHEQYRIFKDHKQKWNDTEEALKLLQS